MENADFFLGLAQQALWITALAAAPILIPALISGLIIGMIQISSRLYAHGIVAGIACFAIWMIASAYLVIHFLGKTQEEIQD